MLLKPTCVDMQATCTAEIKLEKSGTKASLTIQYEAETATVYAFIDDLWIFEQGASPTVEQAMYYLKVNASLVASKLEWNAVRNSVRISTVLGTDSNFDRRAFRSQLSGMIKAADTLRTTRPQP